MYLEILLDVSRIGHLVMGWCAEVPGQPGKMIGDNLGQNGPTMLICCGLDHFSSLNPAGSILHLSDLQGLYVYKNTAHI